MIMKIYMFLLVAILFCFFLFVICYYEYSRTEENSKDEIEILIKSFSVLAIILYIGFYIYNIYVFYIKYSELTSWLTLLCIIVSPILLIAFVLYIIEFKHLLNILKYIFMVPLLIAGIIGSIIYCMLAILTISDGNYIAIGDDKKIYKEYSYSIEIVEMEEIPYTNVSGTRWYIRSAPSIAYYYDVVTENGNQTTKILDGYEYYVEKDEDDKYIDNPHIEVYEIIKEYTNLYGKEKEEHVTYEYTICVPKNSIYYEQ